MEIKIRKCIEWCYRNKENTVSVIIFNKDDLRTKGIGPFIEEKLNALGIYRFNQISKMDSELEDQVNIAIEFFPYRVKRING